jgi:hypothetical protein
MAANLPSIIQSLYTTEGHSAWSVPAARARRRLTNGRVGWFDQWSEPTNGGGRGEEQLARHTEILQTKM